MVMSSSTTAIPGSREHLGRYRYYTGAQPVLLQLQLVWRWGHYVMLQQDAAASSSSLAGNPRIWIACVSALIVLMVAVVGRRRSARAVCA